MKSGSLEAGKWADMVVLNRNPLAMPREQLNTLRVEKLLMKGKPWQGAGALPAVVCRGLVGFDN